MSALPAIAIRWRISRSIRCGRSNNMLWGYIQDEQNRLTVKRRAYEYDHQYGLTLYGKAVPPLRPADSRSKFLESVPQPAASCSMFYKEDNDTTVIADGFPLLNALKEVHLLLAQGAHNQFGDLPWTARGEMLMQQWMLARPEMRDFLQSRRWCPTRSLDAAGRHHEDAAGLDGRHRHAFPRLGVYGEQILLIDPLRRLDRHQRRGLGEELGALLAAGDPGLPARLSCGDGHRPDQSRHGRLHHAGRALAEAAGDATGALRCDAPCSTLPRRSISGCATQASRCAPGGAHDGQAGGSGDRRRAPSAGAASSRRCRAAKRHAAALRRCICSGTCLAFSQENG